MVHQSIGDMLHLLRSAARSSSLPVEVVELFVAKQRGHTRTKRSGSNRRVGEKVLRAAVSDMDR